MGHIVYLLLVSIDNGIPILKQFEDPNEVHAGPPHAVYTMANLIVQTAFGLFNRPNKFPHREQIRARETFLCKVAANDFWHGFEKVAQHQYAVFALISVYFRKESSNY